MNKNLRETNTKLTPSEAALLLAPFKSNIIFSFWGDIHSYSILENHAFSHISFPHILGEIHKKKEIKGGKISEFVIYVGPGRYADLRAITTFFNGLYRSEEGVALFSLSLQDIERGEFLMWSAEKFVISLQKAGAQKKELLVPEYWYPPSVSMPKNPTILRKN